MLGRQAVIMNPLIGASIVRRGRVLVVMLPDSSSTLVSLYVNGEPRECVMNPAAGGLVGGAVRVNEPVLHAVVTFIDSLGRRYRTSAAWNLPALAEVIETIVEL